MDDGFCVIEFLDGPHGPLSDYVHVLANAAYERNAGIPDVVGKRVREMVSEQAANDWTAHYREVLVTGKSTRFERELEETGRYLSLSSFRVEPPELRQVAVLFQDVTERRKAELELRELNQTLERRVADLRGAIAPDGGLPGGEFDKLFSAVWDVNRSSVDVPFSRLASLVTRSSGGEQNSPEPSDAPARL